jgi:hypothetical protein
MRDEPAGGQSPPSAPTSGDLAVVIAAIAATAHATERPAADGAPTSPDAVLDALVLLRWAQAELAGLEPILIAAARAGGISWQALAPALGVASRQAAERRYLRLNPHSTDAPAMTGEQRVQAARDRSAGQRALTQWAHANAAGLRRLAGQITGLPGLDAAAQAAVDRIHQALGDNDTATLLGPLTEAAPHLQEDHPDLAGQIVAIGQTTPPAPGEPSAWPGQLRIPPRTTTPTGSSSPGDGNALELPTRPRSGDPSATRAEAVHRNHRLVATASLC